MFRLSHFQGDLSEWDTKNGTNFKKMFEYSRFNGDISKWNMGNAKELQSMFRNAFFAKDIGPWQIPLDADTHTMFENNDKGLTAQTMGPTMLQVHLRNDLRIADPSWRLALRRYNEMHEALGLDPCAKMQDVAHFHRTRAAPPESLNLPELGLDS